MTINGPILAVQATTTRADSKAVAGRIAPVVPPESYFTVLPDGNRQRIYQPADIEGKICFYRSDSNPFVQAYVVVNTDSGLEWKLVRPGRSVNAFTGELYDPLAGFYNPLAS